MNDEQTRETMNEWMRRARIDYALLYSQLYIAYNSWYQRVTQAATNRDAVQILKKRFMIWIEYTEYRALKSLRAPFHKLVAYTNKRPYQHSNTYWIGSFVNDNDWKGLIECWYLVRCRLLHGKSVDETILRLSYETLYAFMTEITQRMNTPYFIGEDWNVDMVSLPVRHDLRAFTTFDSVLIVDDMNAS